ncbi:hypothetical protein [Clostridium sp. HBUAS56017]|uniref:hypothetical protein n=1 Tax=Clostridium sp. HBUAS56017 TaxID=2571128 RepID=UPI00163D7994|nr:hypothetical protein [Clostridium sp. HBUAS56017]
MAHNKLYRNFIILQEDEKSHGISGEKPLSGYAKIEAKSDKCKISFYAQNLNKDDKYTIVLICYKKDMKQIVDLGSLEVTDVGKGEACKEYYINNIAGLDFSYEKISGAAICKYKDGELSFLMYGFMNGENIKDGWKKCKVIKYADKEDKTFKKDFKKIEKNFDDKGLNKVEDHHVEYHKAEYDDKHGKDLEKHHKENNDAYKEDKCEDEHKDYHKEKHEDYHDKKEEYEGGKEEHHEHHHEEHHDEENKYKHSCKEENDYYDDEGYGAVGEKCSNIMEKESKFDQYEKSIEKTKNRETISDKFELSGDMGKFFNEIVNGFEEYRSKANDIKYCKWYKVNVNSLDDMCNINNYNKYTVAYYPMLNYYPYIKKYGYFMLGYKCDSKGNLKYIVYGVPGKKDEDEQPYAGKTGFVTWMELDSGNEGCWLMFYDFRNSTIVVPMK